MSISLKDKHINETRMQNCGLKAKITNYRNSKDIDVQFQDGTTIEHRQYSEFKNGNIQHPNINRCEQRRKTYKRLGEIKIQSCGLEAEIIDYQNNGDINVQFQDGTTVEHGQYSNFTKKRIGHPTLCKNFNSNIKKIYPRSKSKIYRTQVHGIACVTNDTYYYYCHCPICLAHEIWTFDEIKDHKCNHELVQEREKLIKTRSNVPAI